MTRLASILCLFFLTLFCGSATDELSAGIRFIKTYQPKFDVPLISDARIAAEVKLALKARAEFPWAKATPWEIYANDVLPYAVVNEARDEWRQLFYDKFAPLVKNCKSGTEATLFIARHIQPLIKVKYSTSRRIPHQGVAESLKLGKVSCTGQSILLIAALRSVGIPARMVGLLTWAHVLGNHNWVEAWCDGEWKMIEYNEQDFNTPWVMSSISMLNPHNPQNHIIATTWKPDASNDKFPLIWEALYNPITKQIYIAPEKLTINGINVTPRYIKLASDWVKAQPNYIPGSKIMLRVEAKSFAKKNNAIAHPVTLKSSSGKILASGTSPGPQDDMRKFLEFTLPESEKSAILEVSLPNGSTITRHISHSSTPAQVIYIHL